MIDLETKSDIDIAKSGVYRYADSPYFDILLFAYSIDGQPVQVVDTANGEEIPENVLAALADENVVKRAFNCTLNEYVYQNIFVKIILNIFRVTALTKILSEIS